MSGERTPNYLSGNPNVVDLESRRNARRVEGNKGKIKALMNAGLSTVVISAIGALWIYSESQEAKQTSDQAAALREFNNLSAEFKVHDLVVGSEGVNLRDKPHTEGSVVGDSGEIVGKLEPDTKIDAAIKVIGNDDDAPWVADRHDMWFAFPNPNDPDEIVFANSEFIHMPDAAELVPVADLDK